MTLKLNKFIEEKNQQNDAPNLQKKNLQILRLIPISENRKKANWRTHLQNRKKTRQISLDFEQYRKDGKLPDREVIWFEEEKYHSRTSLIVDRTIAPCDLAIRQPLYTSISLEINLDFAPPPLKQKRYQFLRPHLQRKNPRCCALTYKEEKYQMLRPYLQKEQYPIFCAPTQKEETNLEFAPPPTKKNKTQICNEPFTAAHLLHLHMAF